MKECKKEKSVCRNCMLRGGKWDHSVLSVVSGICEGVR